MFLDGFSFYFVIFRPGDRQMIEVVFNPEECMISDRRLGYVDQ
jgi:hypothetical protein